MAPFCPCCFKARPAIVVLLRRQGAFEYEEGASTDQAKPTTRVIVASQRGSIHRMLNIG